MIEAVTDSSVQPLPALSIVPLPEPEVLPLHGEVGVRRFFIIHAMATIFPLVAGVMLYGWRAALAVGLVLAGAGVGLAVFKRVGTRGRR
ncbi:MAG: hypothetical protein ABIP55_10365, partial [Tepidisphaeraceae bacterium]